MYGLSSGTKKRGHCREVAVSEGLTVNNYLIFFSFYREEDDHGLCLCERCTSSREDQGVSTENQHILHAPLQSLNSHSGLYSDEGCVEREDNPRNHLEDLLDNSHLQTISLDGSSLVEKTPIPELENPGEALFLTNKEKRFMQSHGAHLQGKLCIHFYFLVILLVQLRAALGQGGQYSVNPLSPNSDQRQFSPDDIHTMSRN